MLASHVSCDAITVSDRDNAIDYTQSVATQLRCVYGEWFINEPNHEEQCGRQASPSPWGRPGLSLASNDGETKTNGPHCMSREASRREYDRGNFLSAV